MMGFLRFAQDAKRNSLAKQQIRGSDATAQALSALVFEAQKTNYLLYQLLQVEKEK